MIDVPLNINFTKKIPPNTDYLSGLQIVKDSIDMKNKHVKRYLKDAYFPITKHVNGWMLPSMKHRIETRRYRSDFTTTLICSYEGKEIRLNFTSKHKFPDISNWDGIFNVSKVSEWSDQLTLDVTPTKDIFRNFMYALKNMTEKIPGAQEIGFINPAKIIHYSEDLSDLVLKTQSGDEIKVFNPSGDKWQGGLYSFDEKSTSFVTKELEPSVIKHYQTFLNAMHRRYGECPARQLMDFADNIYAGQTGKGIKFVRDIYDN